MDLKSQEILTFWFGEIDSSGQVSEEKKKCWWEKNRDFDRLIQKSFGGSVREALDGKLDPWKLTAKGRLALILLLDQFTRNIFRDTPDAFSGDPKARSLALEGIENKQDKELIFFERTFFYLPLEHSESLVDQNKCVTLFEKMHTDVPETFKKETAFYLEFARKHRVIIERFGRFPHRNQILGRKSTPEENEFLRQPDSSF